MPSLKPHLVWLHGAWHGPWCWDAVLPFFSDYHCHTPSLPGRNQEDSKTLRKIDLSCYERMLNQWLDRIEGKVVLIAHSMSGLLATKLAHSRADKIKGLIYLGAFIPLSGQSMFDLTDSLGHLPIREIMDLNLKANQVYLDKLAPKLLYSMCAHQVQIDAGAKLCPEPLKAFTSKVILEGSLQAPTLYIKTTQDQVIPHELQTRMIKQSNIDDIQSLASCHSPFLSMPSSCSQLIRAWLAVNFPQPTY